MVNIRQKKVDVIADYIPEAEVYGEANGELLILSWGGTYGACRAAVEKQSEWISVSHLNLEYIKSAHKIWLKL